MDWVTKMLIISFFSLYMAYLTSGEVRFSLNYDYKNYKFMNYRITNKLECNVTGDVPANHVIKWAKDGELFEPTESRFEFKDNQLIIRRTEDSDLTEYNCVLVEKNDPQKLIRFRSEVIKCLGKPTSKIAVVPPTSNPVDEGGKIKLECIVQGHPPPHIYWRKEDTRLETQPGKIEFSDVVSDEKATPQGYLEISNVEMSDRGSYYCSAQNLVSEVINGTDAVIFIRVKDKLAALWPFIGICAEVLVLCIIIFFYERKRNKAELDESDTDQSPEQKNTPDHGKDSVRQRK